VGAAGGISTALTCWDLLDLIDLRDLIDLSDLLNLFRPA
jgi:hypothetical protein